MIRSRQTRAGDWAIAAVCVLLIFICLVPILNVLARSVSSPEALIRNEVLLWPKGWNLQAYQTVLRDPVYTWSLTWTAILTLIVTVSSMTVTILCAFPLIYDQLKGRRVINVIIVVTLYFSAGTIPMYLLLKSLDMLNKPSVLIIPNALSVFNMIILRSFFYGIPDSLRESAEIDGAGPVRTLVRIYLPLSTSVLATLSLFYAVGRWNGFSDALIYMNTARRYHPIQLLLYNILQNTTQVEVATQEGFFPPGINETLKMATVMFATVPIILVYPWLQRYFIHGVTIGAIKG
ncbi:MAG TPA: carbohydrate ABC transporter permease [Candidatus Limnocylindria bacterium]|nr:carbohydrate ABC transporter permease [Candidatus Limnocylindria bacterium]